LIDLPNLQYLNLRGACDIGSIGLKALAGAFKDMPNVNEIDMTSIPICDDDLLLLSAARAEYSTTHNGRNFTLRTSDHLQCGFGCAK